MFNLIKIGNKSNIKNFLSKDDKKRYFQERKKENETWKYRDLNKNPIYFTTNSFGYRTHEFDFDNDLEYFITFGCSNTYGLYLHEEERYSNLLEKETSMKTYNFGIPGGSANIILMNLSKLLYSNVKKPKAVIIQWPECMRINFPYTDSKHFIYRISANTSFRKQGNVFSEFVRHGDIIETQSLWAKDTTISMLESFNIKTISFAKDKIESEFYNVPYVEKIDKAYDNKHMGTLTNKSINDFLIGRI